MTTAVIDLDTPPRVTPVAGRPVLAGRVASVDVLRGAVMVLMALDHVRVFAGVPVFGPPGVFFTRWVTHFCAPIFILFAGTSAYLAGRGRSKGDLSRWLLGRGLLLVVLELTFIRFAWTFNTDWANYTLAGVIWAIGWCMVLLAGLVHLPMSAIIGFGVVIVFGHNAVAPIIQSELDGVAGAITMILYVGGSFEAGAGGPRLVVLYSIVPWIGVMALGYGLGALLRSVPENRDRTLLQIGWAALALFILLRATGLYGDPRPWSSLHNMPSAVAFLNTTKYPASLQFLLMTLGPALALMPVLERQRSRFADWLSVFGRVPFFYYLLHIPVIHLTALAIASARTPSLTPWLFGNHPMLPGPVPPGYQWSLALLYVVTAAVVVALYWPCRWYAYLKERKSNRLVRWI